MELTVETWMDQESRHTGNGRIAREVGGMPGPSKPGLQRGFPKDYRNTKTYTL